MRPPAQQFDDNWGRSVGDIDATADTAGRCAGGRDLDRIDQSGD
jgi:hypothetical protein